MNYTIKKVAKLAGVTERTIRHYDHIGLLKPAYFGENGYRYYQKKQLLILQQILFFRKLGLKLKDIKKILYSDNSEQKDLLKFHKLFLKKKVNQIKTLIQNIDDTIAYLEGRCFMNTREMFQGFFGEKGRGKRYAEYFLKHHLITIEELVEAEKQISKWDIVIWEEINQLTKKIVESLAYSMKMKFCNNSIHVQDIIEQHYTLIKRYLPLNKEAYIGLGKLYCEDDEFKNFYNGPKNPMDGSNMNDGLVDYLAKGMEIYAEKNLTAKPQEVVTIHINQPH